MDDLKIVVIDPNTEDAGILRTSTVRQQVDSDPLPIQKDKIEYSANKSSQTIGAWIELAMPASGKFDTQPLLKALKFFETMPTIKRVWTSIVNRATRGELIDFLMVQREYSKHGILLVDAQGELTSETKDTLEAYGVDYQFNKYDGNEQKIINSVIGARTNWRENLTQLHSAEIKFGRLGYWVNGNTSDGYKKVRVQTEHGRRIILEPNENRSLWFRKIFDLSLKNAPKTVIVDEVNALGYRSRNGTKLNLKQLQKIIENPIYALVSGSCSQRVGKRPLKIKGTPYISIEEFNLINKNKLRIIEVSGEIKILKGEASKQREIAKNSLFPFKQYVLCPVCKSKLWGSSPKGRHGGKYPQYHCSKNHKYWHVSKAEFDKTILKFTQSLKLTDEKLLQYKEALLGKVKDRLIVHQGVTINFQQRVNQLESQSRELLIKIRQSSLLIVQQDLEKELAKIMEEKQIAMAERDKVERSQIDIEMVINRVMYFLEHLEKGLLGIADSYKRAAAWSTIFEEPPTYQDLVTRTPKLRPHIKLISESEDADSTDVGMEGISSNPLILESMIQQFLLLQQQGFYYLSEKTVTS